MKKLNLLLALSGAFACFTLSSGTLAAQDNPPPARSQFDPKQMMQQFQQRMMDRYREQLGITNDDEWKLIEERISKVQEARMAMMGGGTGFMGFGGMGGGMGFGGGQSGGGGGGGGGMRALQGLFGQPSPEAEELQRAVEAKASAADIKEKLAKYRAYKKQKQDNLQKAQDELRKVLTTQQEATLVLNGTLD